MKLYEACRVAEEPKDRSNAQILTALQRLITEQTRYEMSIELLKLELKERMEQNVKP